MKEKKLNIIKSVLNNLTNNGIVKERKNLMFDYGAFESKYKEKV